MFKITLEAARVNAGLSRKEAAKILGITYATLRNYEIGSFLPTPQIAKKMCQTYGIPIEFLVISTRESREANRKTRLYRIWSGIKQRCNNPNCNNYRYYGAKGIRMCDEWSKDFSAFKEWATKNGYADELTIDRIDPAKDYAPDNCQWITAHENIMRAAPWRKSL